MARCSKIELESLPPTKRDAHYLSLKVHLKITQWDKLDNKCRTALGWEWKMNKCDMHPIMTAKKMIIIIIKFFTCKCKVGGKKLYGTHLCCCFKLS